MCACVICERKASPRVAQGPTAKARAPRTNIQAKKARNRRRVAQAQPSAPRKVEEKGRRHQSQVELRGARTHTPALLQGRARRQVPALTPHTFRAHCLMCRQKPPCKTRCGAKAQKNTTHRQKAPCCDEQQSCLATTCTHTQKQKHTRAGALSFCRPLPPKGPAPLHTPFLLAAACTQYLVVCRKPGPRASPVVNKKKGVRESPQRPAKKGNRCWCLVVVVRHCT